MSDLQLFSFQEKEVRVFVIEDEPYFVAQDVAAILEYEKVDKMLDWVDTDDKKVINPHNYIDSASQEETLYSNTFRLSVLNESGVYAVIFNSTKPEAKVFRKWVTSEVLPSIRRTGYYVAPTNNQDVLLAAIAELNNQLQVIKSENIETIQYLRESNARKDNEIEALEEERSELERVFDSYPGLRNAIDFFKLHIDELDEGFTLSEFLAARNINLTHGQKVAVGAAVSNWLKISGSPALAKFKGLLIYQHKHSELLALAICHVLGL